MRERLKERQRYENDVLAWNTGLINGAEHVAHSSMDLCTLALIMSAILEDKEVTDWSTGFYRLLQ